MSIGPVEFVIICCLFSIYNLFGRARGAPASVSFASGAGVLSDFRNVVNAYPPYVPVLQHYCPPGFMRTNYDWNTLPQLVPIDKSMDYADGRNTFSERASPPYCLEDINWQYPLGEYVYKIADQCKNSPFHFLCTVRNQDINEVNQYFSDIAYPAYLSQHQPVPTKTSWPNEQVSSSLNPFISKSLGINDESLESPYQQVKTLDAPSSTWQNTVNYRGYSNPLAFPRNNPLNNGHEQSDKSQLVNPYDFSSDVSSISRQNSFVNGENQYSTPEISRFNDANLKTRQYYLEQPSQLESESNGYVSLSPNEYFPNTASYLRNFEFKDESSLDSAIFSEYSPYGQNSYEGLENPLTNVKHAYGSQNAFGNNYMNGRIYEQLYRKSWNPLGYLWNSQIHRGLTGWDKFESETPHSILPYGQYNDLANDNGSFNFRGVRRPEEIAVGENLQIPSSLPDPLSTFWKYIYQQHSNPTETYRSFGAYQPNDVPFGSSNQKTDLAIPGAAIIPRLDLLQTPTTPWDYPENAYINFIHNNNGGFKRHSSSQITDVVNNLSEVIHTEDTNPYSDLKKGYTSYDLHGPNGMLVHGPFDEQPSFLDSSGNGNNAYKLSHETDLINHDAYAPASGKFSTILKNRQYLESSESNSHESSSGLYIPYEKTDVSEVISGSLNSSLQNEYEIRPNLVNQLGDSYDVHERNVLFERVEQDLLSSVTEASPMQSTNKERNSLLTDAYISYNNHGHNNDMFGSITQKTSSAVSDLSSSLAQNVERPNWFSQLDNGDDQFMRKSYAAQQERTTDMYNTIQKNGILERISQERSASANGVPITAAQYSHITRTDISSHLQKAYDTFQSQEKDELFAFLNQDNPKSQDEVSKFWQKIHAKRRNFESQLAKAYDLYMPVTSGMSGVSSTATQYSHVASKKISSQLQEAYDTFQSHEKDDLFKFLSQDRPKDSDVVRKFWQNIYAKRRDFESRLENAYDLYNQVTISKASDISNTDAQYSSTEREKILKHLLEAYDLFYSHERYVLFIFLNQDRPKDSDLVSIFWQNMHAKRRQFESLLETTYDMFNQDASSTDAGLLSIAIPNANEERKNLRSNQENVDYSNDVSGNIVHFNQKGVPSEHEVILQGHNGMFGSTYQESSSSVHNSSGTLSQNVERSNWSNKVGNEHESYSTFSQNYKSGIINENIQSSSATNQFIQKLHVGQKERIDETYNINQQNGIHERVNEESSISASTVSSNGTQYSLMERTNSSNLLKETYEAFTNQETNEMIAFLNQDVPKSPDLVRQFWQNMYTKRRNFESQLEKSNALLNQVTSSTVSEASSTSAQCANSKHETSISTAESSSATTRVANKESTNVFTNQENANGLYNVYEKMVHLNQEGYTTVPEFISKFWPKMYAGRVNPVIALKNVDMSENSSSNSETQLSVNQQQTSANDAQWLSAVSNSTLLASRILQNLTSATMQKNYSISDKKIEEMTLGWVALLLLAAAAGSKSSCDVESPTRALLCHIGSSLHASFNPCLCTHVIFPNQDFQKDAGRLKARNPKLKVLFKQSETTAAPLPEGADGVYLSLDKHPTKDAFPTELKELATKLDDLSSSKRAKAKYEGQNDGSESDELELILELPAEPKRLAKHYDIKSLAKYVRYFVVPSDNLTDSSQDGLAYHPSRLMGIDDILNADSLVDLLSSMGADHDKLIISLPAYGLQFTLKDDKNNMPGSAVSGAPVKISQNELCKLIGEGGWTLEREEDMTAPYAYKENKWVSFDDATSASIKGKYVLLRNLGGLSVSFSEDDDWAHSCAGRPLVDVLHHTLTNLARKSRAAQLLSLQDQIHNSLLSSYSGDVQLSPFRIVRVVDRAGAVHVVRKEAKTEFQCSRQGYFTHPSGCNRFYRCVKFNQYSSDFTVFEYDCPAGLAFDERYEVCVWPGSLPDAAACKGSSEIAPVPRSRFACSQEGYYADPENCRWFFACLDHQRDGHTPPTAYEFRCPFGLVFDNEKLACDWPWKVAGCGSGYAGYATVSTGTIYPGDILEGRLRPSYAQVSDDHVSGGRIPNVEGGLVLGTSLLSGISSQGSGAYTPGSSTHYGNGYGSGNLGAAAYGDADNSGAYVHDPTGDSGGEYVHQEGAQVPYIHQDGPQVPYVHQSDSGSYKHQGDSGAYRGDGDSGAYRGDGSSGAYRGDGDSGAYRGDGNSGAYRGDGGSGSYRGDGAYDHQGDSGTYRGDGSYVVQGDSGGYRGKGSSIYVHQGDNGAYRGEGVYVQQGDSGAYKVDGGSSYVHQGDSGTYRGDGASGSGGAYSGQGASGASSYQGQGTYVQSGGGQLATGGSYLAGGLVKSEITSSGASSGGAYQHDTRGDYGGAYSHDSSGDRGVGYTFISGASGSGSVSGGAYVANNAGSLVKTGTLTSSLKTGPAGISSGTYTLGSSYANDVKTAGIDSGAYLGGVGYVSGSKSLSSYSSGSNADQSGAYVHDTRGDSGGEYVHRDTLYVHQDGAQVPYKHQSDSGSYVHQDGAQVPYIHQGDSGSYVHQGDSGSYVHQGDSGSYVHQGDSGSYVHQGDSGSYVHQGDSGAYIYQGNRGAYRYDGASNYQGNNVPYYGGKYTVGQGAYNLKTDLYKGSGNVYGSGAYVHDSRGDNGGAYNQAGYRVSVPVKTYGLDFYHQTSPVIHGYGSSGQNVQSVGYVQPAVRVQPITVTGAPAVPLKSVQYIQPAVRPVVATTPVPSVIGYQYRKPVAVVQPISVSTTPTVPLNSVQYVQPVQKIQPVVHQTIQPVLVSTPAPPVVSYGYRTPAISTISVPKATVLPITVSSTPRVPLSHVQYVTSTPAPSLHVDAQRLQPLQSYSYTKPSVRLETPVVSYQQPVQNVYVSTPAPPTLIKTQEILPVNGYSYPQPTVKPIVSYQQPVFVSTPAPPVQRVQPVSQVVYSTPAPTYVSSTVRPITVSSTPIVPLNPVQYNVPCTDCAVSQTARPLTVTATPIKPAQPSYSYTYTSQQQPICTTCATAQTARPITVTSAPIVPLNPVQYSTPAPAVVAYSYPKPAVKFETPVVQQIHTYKQPEVQQTYTYKQSVVQQTYKQPEVQQIYTNEQPVVQQTYTYKQPAVQQTYTYKQPVVQPIAVSTPAQPVVSYSYQKPAQPLLFSTPSPSYVSSTVSPITVSSTPVVPLNPVQYVKQIQPLEVSKPASEVVGYSYPKPTVKFETPLVQQTYTYKQPVVQQSYTYKQPVVHSVVQPIAVTTAAPPVQTYTYIQKQKPVAQQTYTYRQPVVQQTYTYRQPVVEQSLTYKRPIQPIVLSTPTPPVVSYSYQKPSQPIVYSTQAPTYVSSTIRPITVSSTPIVPLNPVQYTPSVSTPAPPVVGYSYPKPAVKLETPAVQQTYIYQQPAVQQTYTYKQPVVQQTYSYKQPVAVSTPAPPVVSYSYQKPVQPIVYSTPAPAVVSSTLRPITVSSTPVVPLNPVQYVSPVQPTYVSTPSPPVVSYTYQKPEYKTQPIQTYNTVQYQQPIYKVTTPAPPVVVSSTPKIPLNPVQYNIPVQPSVVSYKQTVPTHPPSVISYQPVRANPQPIVDYSYEQQTPVSYSYPKPAVRFETPTFVSTPAPPVVKYEQQYIKQVVSSPAPAVVSYSYQPVKSSTVTPITVSSTPVIPYSPVQYVKPAPPRPQISYSYVSQPTPAPAVVNYESLKVVTTPAPPVVNYSYKPVSPVVVSTPAPTVSYYRPAIKTQTPRPYISVSSTPAPVQYVAPAKTVQPLVSYNYVKPQPFAIHTESQGSYEYSVRQQPIRPAITVTSTPAIPLAPVQYTTAQPKPIYRYDYVNPTSTVVETAAPVYTPTYRVTTPRPAITVTSTPAVPLAPVQYVQPAPVKPIYNYNYVRPTTTYVETPAPVVQTYKVTTPRPVIVQTTTEQPFVEYKPVRVRPAERIVPVVQPSLKPIEYTITVKPSSFRKTPVVTTTEQPLGVSYYEEYFDSKKTGGYEYKQPAVQLKEERVPFTSTVGASYGYQGEVHSSSFAPIIVPEISTVVPARRRPVHTYVNTVEEESYYSSTPGSIDVHDENLNVHLDIPRVGVQQVYSTTPEQVVEVTSVAPAVKRVRVGGSSSVAGGYYVRKQKVRVRPVVTTTENYPAFFTTTVKPVYSSTVDLSSPTLYSTTVRPTYTTTYRPTSTTPDDELDVEEEDDSKLVQEVSGGFGSVLTSGDSGFIKQGSLSSTTVSSLKDGEAIVGYVKKEREQFTGRRRTKVVVVSRLSDFNPLLVGKLGAECSCKSDSKTLDLTSTRTRGKLFRPVTTTTVVQPSRDYLPTSTTPLPDELTNFDYDDARPPGQIVEIKPVRKTQRVYTTTGTPLDVSTIEYVSSTRPARKIASASDTDGKLSSSSASRGKSTRLDPEVDCQRPGLFRHPHLCNKFYSCNWDEWKKRYTVSVFNCPIHLAFDSKLGACNWPSKGPACAENNLLV